MNRRRFLQVLATVGAGAVAGSALPRGVEAGGEPAWSRTGALAGRERLTGERWLERASETGRPVVSGLVAGTRAVVTADLLNVRGGPDVDEPIVGGLAGGTAVDLLAPSGDGSWWRVASESAVGHVSAAYLEGTGAPAALGAFDVDLAIGFQRQLDPVWCDPADIQMWLEYKLGRSLGPSYEVQQTFWNWELENNAGFTVEQWNCSPFAIASAAHRWLPTQGFNHFTYDDPLAGTRLMAWLLAHPGYREPSIATVWRGDHYILVRGFRATADPYRDPSAQILGLYVADPNKGKPSWLGQDRFIPVDEWVNQHFTRVTYTVPGAGVPGDVWQGKCVTVQRDWTVSGPSLEGRRNATGANYSGG